VIIRIKLVTARETTKSEAINNPVTFKNKQVLAVVSRFCQTDNLTTSNRLPYVMQKKVKAC
jgi:hypothetical protein